MLDKRIPLPSGNQIKLGNDYYIIKGEPIGHGASCLVYEAEKQGFLGHAVIIKEFYPIDYENCIKRDADDLTLIFFRRQLLIEKRKVEFINGAKEQVAFYEKDSNHRLSFPTSIEANNTVYLITELTHGQILSYRRVDLTVCDIAQVMQSLCNAISLIHESRKLYLDIKPDNVFVFDKDVSYRIGLFDFDTVLSNKKDILDKSFGVASKYWVAQEQRKWSTTEINVTADIFSIGALFFWLISGKEISDGWLDEVIDRNNYDNYDYWNSFHKLHSSNNATKIIKDILAATLATIPDERINNVDKLNMMFKHMEELVGEYKYLSEKLDKIMKSTNAVDCFAESHTNTLNLTKTDIYECSKQNYIDSRKNGSRFHNLSIVSALLPQGIAVDSYFVEYAKTESGNVSPILDIIKNYSNKNISIVGEGGIGKTTCLVKIMDDIFNNINETIVTPIFIELNRCPVKIGSWISDITGDSNFILRYIVAQITKKHDLSSISENDILYVINEFNKPKTCTPEYLLLLDGFNEVNNEFARNIDGTSTSLTIRYLLKKEILYLMNCSNVRIIITSRRIDQAYFDKNEFNAENIELIGLKPDVITNYLYDQLFDEITINAVKSNYALMDCLRIPLFLCMFASTKRNSSHFRPETRGEILFSFFNAKRNDYNETTASERINIIKANEAMFIRDFILSYLGWKMQRENSFSFDRHRIITEISCFLSGKDNNDKLTTDLIIAFPTYSSESRNVSDIKRSLMNYEIGEILGFIVNTLSIMYHDEDFNYSFIHHHIRDYFAAIYEIQWLRLSSAFIKKFTRTNDEKYLSLATDSLFSITNGAWSYDECVFVGEILSEQRNAPICINNSWKVPDKIETQEQLILKSILDVFRISNKSDYYGLTNIIGILKSVRHNLAGENFRNLDLSFCNLYEVNCSIGTSPNELSSVFSRSKISGSTFRQQGHRDGISEYRYTNHGELLITVSPDQTVKQWNVVSGTCIDTIKIDKEFDYSSFECSGFGQNFSLVLYNDTIDDENESNSLIIRRYSFSLNGNTIIEDFFTINNPTMLPRIKYSKDNYLYCIFYDNIFYVYHHGNNIIEAKLPINASLVLDFDMSGDCIYVVSGLKDNDDITQKLSCYIDEINIKSSIKRTLHTFEVNIIEYSDSNIPIIDEMIFLLHATETTIFFSEPEYTNLRKLDTQTLNIKSTALECSDEIIHCSFAADNDNIIFALKRIDKLNNKLIKYNIREDSIEGVYHRSNMYFYDTGNHLQSKLLMFDNDFFQPIEWDLQHDKCVSKYSFKAINISCALVNEVNNEIIFLFRNDCMYAVDAENMTYKYGFYLGEPDASIHLYAYDHERNILWLLFESDNREKEFIKYYSLYDMSSECLYYEITDEHSISTIHMSCQLDALFIATNADILMLNRVNKKKKLVYHLDDNERILEIVYDDTINCLNVISCYRTDDGKLSIKPKMKKFKLSEQGDYFISSWYEIPTINESDLYDFIVFRDISQMDSYTSEFRLDGYLILSGVFYHSFEFASKRTIVQEHRLSKEQKEIVVEVSLSQTDINYYLVKMTENAEEQINEPKMYLIDYNEECSKIVTLDKEGVLYLSKTNGRAYQVESNYSIAHLNIDNIDGVFTEDEILYFWLDSDSVSNEYSESIYSLNFVTGAIVELKRYDPGVMINYCNFSDVDANNDVKMFLAAHGGAGIKVK